MLQKDDLKQVVSELVEELVGKKSQPDLTSEESDEYYTCLLYTSPSPRDRSVSRMPSSA